MIIWLDSVFFHIPPEGGFADSQLGGYLLPVSAVLGQKLGDFQSLGVLYQKLDCWRYEHELDACLVDTQVIAQCPIRYNAAGILDAMAKRIEIQNGKPVMRLSENKIDLFSAFRWAEFTYEMLREFGPQAIEDNRQKKVT